MDVEPALEGSSSRIMATRGSIAEIMYLYLYNKVKSTNKSGGLTKERTWVEDLRKAGETTSRARADKIRLHSPFQNFSTEERSTKWQHQR